MNEADGDESRAPSFSEACVGLVLSLLVIIGGIWYWDYWNREMDRKAAEEVQRMIRNMERQRESIDRQFIEEVWKKKQQRDAELLAPVLRAMEQRRMQK
jgi:hypothetical protein